MASASSKPEASNPPNVPTPPPTYSQLCVTPILPQSKLITLAGQTGLQSDGSIASDIETQAKDAYKSILECLKAAGATPRDIVMTEAGEKYGWISWIGKRKDTGRRTR
ncbi:hypothetical protein HBI56_063230 [Parastagonospora nodorum]|nr:hypothetical protein HBH56_197740 [Parastagonospora nodorum]KAH3924578.1 hypothetical protein HBH54_190700 [Parastagonospora nodorum]KAH3966006.1 hypothetical protein HBH52_201170 [Parastagonospora nodorum]KAH4002385.1 hypothetical protein HBI10_076100 [Parastagonospora nodorum]KAH4025951.1 hypothetical protein HBI13_071910 [Parastagonospora nodorum]